VQPSRDQRNSSHAQRSRYQDQPNYDQQSQNTELYEVDVGCQDTTLSHSTTSLDTQPDHHYQLSEQRKSKGSHTHLTYANRIFTWPTVQALLLSAGFKSAYELAYLLERGTARFLEQQLQKHPHPLSFEVRLHGNGQDRCIVEPRQTFLEFTPDEMQKYAKAYFNSFNMLYPILEYDEFMQLVVPLCSTKGFGDGCVESVLALAVFALGKLAFEGTEGDPIPNDGTSVSGIRGGSIQNPPGLEIFNEVRRRLGFVQIQCRLESVQILLLTA
jgi:hypothetical protein